MVELPIAISLMAFAVSVASLTISLFGYLRDHSKLRAWSTIIWQFNGPESETPILHIQVANIGRRPVLVINLVKRARKSKWWSPIQRPILKGELTVELIEKLKENSLAHNVAVKLSEGEILELTFRPEDCDEFVSSHEDQPIEAIYLQIEDVAGRIYPVKDSAKNLATLFKAWKP